MTENETLTTTIPKYWDSGTTTSTIEPECWCNHNVEQHEVTFNGKRLGCNKCDCNLYDINYVWIKARTEEAKS